MPAGCRPVAAVAVNEIAVGVLGGFPQGIPPELVVGQTLVQAAPLRVNEVGLAVLPVWVAWKPMLTDPPAAMAPL